MVSWPQYIGAFLGGVLGTAVVYVITVLFVMNMGPGLPVAGFVGLVFLLPVMAGFVAFGFSFQKITKTKLESAQWMNGAAFTCAITIVCSGLLMSRALGSLPALILLIGLLFAGGRILTRTKADE